MRSLAIPMLALALAGCGRADNEPPVPAASLTPAANTSAVSGPTAPATDPSYTPPTDPGDPAMLIARWRQALETHDYAAARAPFGRDGADSGMSAPAFADAWDKYRIIDITVGPGEQEGAAGSVYYEAPVTVTGLKRDGTPYDLSGTITLRRVNGVDGATAEQLAWHIERTTLRP